MRFHLGPVPLNPSFDPPAQGWKPIREPGPLAIQLLAVPVALAIFFVLGLAIYNLSPTILSGLNQLFSAAPGMSKAPGNGLRQAAALLAYCTGLLGIIAAHEFVHAFCMPGMGLTPQTLIAAWPKALMFYAYYDGELSRNRLLLVYAAPFLALSILPLIAAWGLANTTASPAWVCALALLALINGVSASGDVIGFVLVLAQIPSSAAVRNHGWRTFWRMEG